MIVTSITLQAKLDFLRQPESYPTRTSHVEAKETHMSWVFLTETEAWKLKKPVQVGIVDFSTLDARHFNCEEEVRLNGRLAPGVYYGVTPLTIEDNGRLRLAGGGEIIDWLVCMRRLPAERMLDCLIARRAVSSTDISKIARVLASFYSAAIPLPLTPLRYREWLKRDVVAVGEELKRPQHKLSQERVESIVANQLESLRRDFELFDGRAANGKIIEGHGDLRPEHICLETEPLIIDCLEFNRDLRILDPALELSFLALECERIGAPEVGAGIIRVYCEQTGDRPADALLAFYRRQQASVRAQLAVWHLRDTDDPDKWARRAEWYLTVAERPA